MRSWRMGGALLNAIASVDHKFHLQNSAVKAGRRWSAEERKFNRSEEEIKRERERES